MKNKYNARKTTIDGITFDSKREAARYQVLKAELDAGKITGLRLQPAFELIPAYKSPSTGRRVRAIKYIADFEYYRDGEKIIEDVKGYRTREYRNKKKAFEYIYGIPITEI